MHPERADARFQDEKLPGQHIPIIADPDKAFEYGLPAPVSLRPGDEKTPGTVSACINGLFPICWTGNATGAIVLFCLTILYKHQYINYEP
jgi:hypothetical protein